MALFDKLVKAVKKMFQSTSPRRSSRRAKKTSRSRKTGRGRTRSRSRSVSQRRRSLTGKVSGRPSRRRVVRRRHRAVSKGSRPVRSTVGKKAPGVVSARQAAGRSSAGPRRLGSSPLSKAASKQKAAAVPAKPIAVPKPEPLIGEITHYFSKIMVVVLKITSHPIKVGDTIHVKGHASDFTQTVESLQIESVNVPFGKKGQLVGLKVIKPARVGDQVFWGRKTPA